MTVQIGDAGLRMKRAVGLEKDTVDRRLGAGENRE
jgi:hypothetical protein